LLWRRRPQAPGPPELATNLTQTRASVICLRIVDQLRQVPDRIDIVMRGGEINDTPGVRCGIRKSSLYLKAGQLFRFTGGWHPCATLISISRS